MTPTCVAIATWKYLEVTEDFDPLPRMAAIYGMAELCGVGHRKALVNVCVSERNSDFADFNNRKGMT